MRWLWIGLAAASFPASASGATVEEGRILVVVADRAAPAFQEAMQGLARGLAPRAIVQVAPAKLDDALKSAGGPPVRVVVAMGAEARAALAKAKVDLPVVSTMLLLADAANEAGPPLVNPVGSVYLDLEIPQIARELGRLFPARKRLGLIAGPASQTAPNRAALEQLERDGYSVQVADCPRRADLSNALRTLKGKVDMVLCLPDPSLFDSRTIPVLLRSALEIDLAVIGFSPALVRAGAMAGVFPDYGEIGMQTAAMVTRALASPAASDVGEETPRKVASAGNSTVMRLLGWGQ